MDWSALLQAVGMLLTAIGGSAVLATVTKNSSANPKIDKVLRGINFAAMNIGQAKNKRK